MSWSKWAFTPKFNYATGNYEGFWQESEIKYFVDTIKGRSTLQRSTEIHPGSSG